MDIEKNRWSTVGNTPTIIFKAISQIHMMTLEIRGTFHGLRKL
jgi:hypothetical protein